MTRAWVLVFVALVGMGLSLSSAPRIEAARPSAARAHLLYVPSGRYLSYASVGFQRLTADMLYLWAVQYASNEKLLGQDTHLPRVFDVITDLDPTYEEAYLTGAFILAADAGRLEEALALLDKALAKTGRFVFPYDAGFYCFLFARDYPRARAYFERAASLPGCPIYVRRLALKMASIIDPRSAYDLYRQEWRDFHRSHTADQIAADVQKKRHVSFMRHRICELEIDLETEALERLLAVSGSGEPTLGIEELAARARSSGFQLAVLEPANDPLADCHGVRYELKDGKAVPGQGLTERAGR